MFTVNNASLVLNSAVAALRMGPWYLWSVPFHLLGSGIFSNLGTWELLGGWQTGRCDGCMVAKLPI